MKKQLLFMVVCLGGSALTYVRAEETARPAGERSIYELARDYLMKGGEKGQEGLKYGMEQAKNVGREVQKQAPEWWEQAKNIGKGAQDQSSQWWDTIKKYLPDAIRHGLGYGSESR